MNSNDRCGSASRYLSRIAIRLRGKIRLVEKISSRMAELDIAACRIEREIAADWARNRNKINEQLDKLGISETEWCRRELGCSIQTMRRRLQLLKGWPQYLKRRREVGDNGQYGLLYAASLASPSYRSESAITAPFRSVRSAGSSLDLTRCDFITGDALAELRKMPARSVNVIVCSPPYWPPKRAYGKDRALGFEETLPDYIRDLVAIFREARRVLRDDGVLWVVIDDAYMHRRTLYGQPENYGRRSKLGLATQMGINTQSNAEDRLFGNLMFIPERLAMSMQDDGWLCRSEIIWDKGPEGRKESVSNRPRHNFEKVLMFTETTNYVFDLDPIREPLAARFYTTPAGRSKAPVASFSARRRSSGFKSLLAAMRWSISRLPPVDCGATSVSQIAVSAASTWQKNGRMSPNLWCRQCWRSRTVSGVTCHCWGFGNLRQLSTP